MNFRANAPQSNTTKEEQNFYLGVGFVSLPIIMGYMLSMLESVPDCDEGTFWHGHNISPFLILIGLMSCMTATFSYLSILGSLFVYIEIISPKSLTAIISRNKMHTVFIASMFSIIAGLIWYTFNKSFFCLDPVKVTVHSLFSGYQVHDWSEVKTIEAGCEIGKHENFASFRIGFANGRPVTISFQDDNTEAFTSLRSALSQAGYHYFLSSSATVQSCPPGMYRLLSGWGRAS